MLLQLRMLQPMRCLGQPHVLPGRATSMLAAEPSSGMRASTPNSSSLSAQCWQLHPAGSTRHAMAAPATHWPIRGRWAGATRSMAASASTDTPSAVVAYVTVPDADTGKRIATSLVERHLVACVNIVPGLTSVYWWDGKVNSDSELLLIIKTRHSLVPALTEAVKAMHPYDEPEVIAMPVIGGSASYLKWVQDSTADAVNAGVKTDH